MGTPPGSKEVTFSADAERPPEEEEEVAAAAAAAAAAAGESSNVKGGHGGGGGGGGDESDDVKEEKLSRKFSCASTDTNLDDDDDDEANLDEEDDKNVVLLGPQLPLKDQLELDKDDESLRRWKEQLLGNVDLNAVGESSEPEVQILSLTIQSPGREDAVLPFPLAPNDKGIAFALKDGSRYRLSFTFTVSNNIVSGLKYTNTVWKTGMRVDNTKVMLGTFSPRLEPYTYELAEETTPSGMFARGAYSARTKFADDDGKCYLDITYYFEIRKDWPATS